MKDKTLDRITYAVLIMFILMITFFIYVGVEMWKDHLCYIDGHYDTPECIKYIKGDE